MQLIGTKLYTTTHFSSTVIKTEWGTIPSKPITSEDQNGIFIKRPITTAKLESKPVIHMAILSYHPMTHSNPSHSQHSYSHLHQLYHQRRTVGLLRRQRNQSTLIVTTTTTSAFASYTSRLSIGVCCSEYS